MNIYQNCKFFHVLIYNLDHFFYITSCNLMISFNLTRIKSFIKICRNISSICFNSSVLLEGLKIPNCYPVCFSKAFPKEEYAILA